MASMATNNDAITQTVKVLTIPVVLVAKPLSEVNGINDMFVIKVDVARVTLAKLISLVEAHVALLNDAKVEDVAVTWAYPGTSPTKQTLLGHLVDDNRVKDVFEFLFTRADQTAQDYLRVYFKE
jgi:hypothetical protein